MSKTVRANAGKKSKTRANSAKTDEHRIRILDSAAECFMRNGFEASTIDDIAEAIGSTKGLIYYSFRSKADLFFAVYERSIEVALAELYPLTQLPETGLQRLSRVCERHISLLMETLPYHVVTRLGIESHLYRAMTPEQRQKLQGLKILRDRYEKMFADLIQDGMLDGTIRQVDVSLAAKTLLGAINSVSVWYRPRSAETEAERQSIAKEVAGVVIAGLAKSHSGE